MEELNIDKRCSGCEIYKNIIEFHKNKSSKDGLNNNCKTCKSFYYKGLKKENKRFKLAANNQKKCPFCKTIKQISNFFNNKSTVDNLSAYCRTCSVIANNVQYQKNKLQYYCKLCSKLINRGKYCELCHIVHMKEYRKNYSNKQRENISYKIKSNISRSIRANLKKVNMSKRNLKTLTYLQYSIQELKDHLEKQFEPWMTWQNHGSYLITKWNDNDSSTWVWNIDHIIPQSKLQYHSMGDDNFKKCWALSNLRPYSAKQNIIDSCRR